MAKKDYWNGQRPHHDSQFVGSYAHPELAGLLPVLYPGVFPKLAAYTKDRVDLEAILLTGIPGGIVPGFQNSTGSTAADLLRLNMAIPPSSSPSPLGILGGDLAGFPNGRRVKDDVVTIEIRAVAGLTIPLVDPTFTPDGAAGLRDAGPHAQRVALPGDVPVPGPAARRVRQPVQLGPAGHRVAAAASTTGRAAPPSWARPVASPGRPGGPRDHRAVPCRQRQSTSATSPPTIVTWSVRPGRSAQMR